MNDFKTKKSVGIRGSKDLIKKILYEQDNKNDESSK